MRLQLEALEIRANPVSDFDAVLPTDWVSTTEESPVLLTTAPEVESKETTAPESYDAENETPIDETVLKSNPGDQPEDTFPGDPILTMTLAPTSGDASEPIGETQNSDTGEFSVTSIPTEETTPSTEEGQVEITTVPSTEPESESDGEEPDPILTSAPGPTQPLPISPGELDRLINGFIGSREYARNQVQSQFLRYLDRLAQAQGLENWTTALEKGQVNAHQLAAYLVSSPENIAASGFNAHTIFSNLYEDALDREADPVGLESWTKSLFLGVGPQLNMTSDDALRLYASDKLGVANQALMASPIFQRVLREKVLAFLQTQEYRKNAVRTIYGGILGRDATDPEIQGWVNYLAKGYTEQHLVGLFLRTPEYRSQFQSNRGLVTGLYDDLLFRAPDAQGYLRWTGSFDAQGNWHAPTDPEFTRYYQELVAAAQMEGTTVVDLLQTDLDVAYAARIDTMPFEKLPYLATQNPNFTIGVAGSFLKNLLSDTFPSDVNLQDPQQIFQYLTSNGEEIGQALEAKLKEMFPEGFDPISSGLELDLSQIAEGQSEMAEEMFDWVKGLYVQSLPQRVSQHLPPPETRVDWLQWFIPGGIPNNLPVPGGEIPPESDELPAGTLPAFDTPVVTDSPEENGSIDPNQTPGDTLVYDPQENPTTTDPLEGQLG